MANTMKALQTFTIGAGGAASVDFTNIPQTYTDLKVVISGRNTDTGNNFQAILLTVNNDGTAGSWKLLYGQNGAAFSGANSGYLQPSFTSSATNTSNTFSNAEIYFPNYASNVAVKSFSSDFVTENNSTSANANIYGLYSNLWNNNTPINRLTFTSNISNFVQYTTFTLYGVFNQDVSSVPNTPTIGTATAGNASASITFTGVSGAASYTMTSTPGSFTATGTTSPITVSGLTNGTSYTFTVQANNPLGSSGQSAASNSVTPVAPVIPLLGAWTTAGTSVPSASASDYYGVSLVSGEPRVFAFASGRSTTSYYNNGAGGTWTTSGAARPVGQGLGSSSKSMTNSGLFYTYGGDTGTQTLVYSTQTGGSWTTQASMPYNAGWSDGCYFKQSGTDYLISAADYPSGNPSGRAVIDTSTGALTWSTHNNYPVYASAPRFARLTNVPIGMGGFTSTSLSATRTNVYSFNVSSNAWTSETSLPFTPGGGYLPATSLVGPADSRIYVSNFGTALWSRGDSSGTWRSETATPSAWEVGWGTVTSGGSYRLQLSNGSGNTYFQTVI